MTLLFSLSVLSIIRLLIRCKANVDEVVPSTKSTPLHIIAECDDIDIARSVIMLLLEANAHTDFIDKYGRLPEDCAQILEIKMCLRSNRKLSLKCRCAQLINLKNVYYENCLSSNLINFVEMHSRKFEYCIPIRTNPNPISIHGRSVNNL